ncbi:MAG TPA: TRIC cation channel family protein [Candidatus Stackebrandtia excrementipullorum]|nr:TRIC cation channel family protein [Candidatus Stackebrandtia excrementipullorum]
MVVEWGFVTSYTEATVLDLFAASTNALSSAILVRRPDHYRDLTVSGVLAVSLIGGIGGSVARDLLIGRTPMALTNPIFVLSCLIFGGIGYRIALDRHRRFREGVFQCVTSFALAWYAVVGVKASVEYGVTAAGAVVVGVVAATGGRYFVDVTCGVPAIRFLRAEWFVVTAMLACTTWLVCTSVGLDEVTGWAATIMAVLVGFLFRLVALYRGWREPVARPPSGVHRHRMGGFLLGRRLTDKSKSDLRNLGLTVATDETPSDGTR